MEADPGTIPKAKRSLLLETTTIRDPERMSSEEGVWATVTATTMNWRVKKYLVRFERGLWFIVDPGKNFWDMKPRNVERTDPFTLNVETGFWNYGKVTLKFDSSRDADGVEEKIRGMLSK